MTALTPRRPTLLQRLDQGPVICAEGYVFELERRGYLQAGAFVPEVVLEHPEAVTQLHRDFVHAGSDVVEALTYYAHREKLKVIGREGDLERINRAALAIAKDVASESSALVAGNICNTNVFDPADRSSHDAVRAMFEEQVGWAVDAGVDFIIGETFSYAAEALIALEVVKKAKQVAVMTLAMHQSELTRENWSVVDSCKRPRRWRCGRRWAELHQGPLDDDAATEADQGGGRHPRRGAAGSFPYDREPADVSIVARHSLARRRGEPAVPDRARPVHLQSFRDRGVRPPGGGHRHPLPRRVLWRRARITSARSRRP